MRLTASTGAATVVTMRGHQKVQKVEMMAAASDIYGSIGSVAMGASGPIRIDELVGSTAGGAEGSYPAPGTTEVPAYDDGTVVLGDVPGINKSVTMGATRPLDVTAEPEAVADLLSGVGDGSMRQQALTVDPRIDELMRQLEQSNEELQQMMQERMDMETELERVADTYQFAEQEAERKKNKSELQTMKTEYERQLVALKEQGGASAAEHAAELKRIKASDELYSLR